MSTQDFFPNAAFAWVFCCSVILLTVLAAIIDTRTAKIPNRLTLVILFTGVAFTLIRSVWQTLVDPPHPLFAFETGSPWLGGLDGVLFALLGFLLAFGLYFAFWIFGLAGGGDVKLMAALGVWFGVSGFLYIWVTSIFTLLLWTGLIILYAKATGKKNFGTPKATPVKKAGKLVPQKKGLRVTYAVPVAVATVLASLWMYRVDLQLMPPKSKPADQTGGATDAPPKSS